MSVIHQRQRRRVGFTHRGALLVMLLSATFLIMVLSGTAGPGYPAVSSGGFGTTGATGGPTYSPTVCVIGGPQWIFTTPSPSSYPAFPPLPPGWEPAPQQPYAYHIGAPYGWGEFTTPANEVDASLGSGLGYLVQTWTAPLPSPSPSPGKEPFYNFSIQYTKFVPRDQPPPDITEVIQNGQLILTTYNFVYIDPTPYQNPDPGGVPQNYHLCTNVQHINTPPVVQYNACADVAFIMIVPASANNGGEGAANNNGDTDPVNGVSGQYYYATTDISIPARGIPLTVSRLHQTQQVAHLDMMPEVWNWNVTQWLDFSQTANSVKYTYPDGRWVQFVSSDGVTFLPRRNTSDADSYGDITDSLFRLPDGSFNLISHGKAVTHFSLFQQLNSDESFYLISSITDVNGDAMTWNYNTGKIASISDPAGRQLNFDMDPITVQTGDSSIESTLNVKINSITDWTGRKWTYGNWITFPHLGSAPGSFTTPENQTWLYTYDTNGRMLTVTDPRGNQVIANTYDSTDTQVVHQTRANGDSWDYTYGQDSAGNTMFTVTRSQNGNPEGLSVSTYDKATGGLIKYLDSLGHVETYTVSPLSGRRTSRTDALGNTWLYHWDDTRGLLIGTSDPLGNSWTFQYDPVTQHLTQITTPLSQTWNYQLDNLGNMVGVSDPLGHATTIGRDPYGQITSLTNALGDTTQASYDVNGYLQTITTPAGIVTNFTEDAVGNTIKVTDALGHNATADFDKVDRLTAIKDALGNSATYTYDSADNVTAAKDSRGYTSTVDYSSINLPTQSTDPLGGTTKLSYDGRNNLSNVRNANGVDSTSFTSNLIDQATKQTYVGDVSTIAYDTANRPYQFTRPDGSGGAATLDARGYPLRIDYSDGSFVAYTWDAVGRRTQMVDPLGTTTYRWDAANRLSSKTQYGKTIRYQYDDSNRRTLLTDGNGVDTNYSYDKDGRLTKVSRGHSVVCYSYDGAGRLTQKAFSNGVSCQYHYDDADRLISLQWLDGRCPIHSNSYAYDANYNRVSNIESTSDGIHKWSYSYDPLNRLSSATADSELTSYKYDSVGNRLSVTTTKVSDDHDDGREHKRDHRSDERGDDRGSGDDRNSKDHRNTHGSDSDGHDHPTQDSTFTYNTKNQLVSSNSTSYQWDANGNLVSKSECGQTTRYTWDVRNHLIKVTNSDGSSLSFTYTGDGLLASRTTQDGQVRNYLWDGLEVVNEYDGSGAATTSYMLGIARENIVAEGACTQTHWNISDGLGSIVALTSDEGRVTDSYSFDAWGQRTAVSGNTYNPYQFVGAFGVRSDVGQDVVYMRSRWYQPSLQRFISRDPARKGVNAYVYASNNPTTYIDPMGMAPTIQIQPGSGTWGPNYQNQIQGGVNLLTSFITNVHPELLDNLNALFTAQYVAPSTGPIWNALGVNAETSFAANSKTSIPFVTVNSDTLDQYYTPAFLAWVLLHESQHIKRGACWSRTHPFSKEKDANAVATDAILNELQDYWNKLTPDQQNAVYSPPTPP